MFPLFLLNLSRGKRLLIVILSYGVAVPGLWFVFPQLNNGASMVLPIICLCWLFSYRGLLISFFSTAATVGLVYHYFSGDTFPVQAVVERVTLGFVISLLLGLTICWLRTAVDLVQVARQQALNAEQERLLAVEKERQVTIGYEQQRKINELKDHFLLHVSHELRTPLAVLGSSLELLKEYHELLDPVERAQALTQALASQEALVDLVNRVLDTTVAVSKIPLAKPEAVCVHALLQETVADLAPEERDAYTIGLQVSEQIMVWADPHLLQQVLHHLLSNVFKYVPKQTAIHIETTQATPSSPVYLSIQDAGPGIPVEELPLLFERFVRLKRDLAGATRGIGLGLYICKQLVETMNGRIWVESSGRPGEGCRFCLTLPPFLPLLLSST
jgi:signal transduction histidine kinase